MTKSFPHLSHDPPPADLDITWEASLEDATRVVAIAWGHGALVLMFRDDGGFEVPTVAVHHMTTDGFQPIGVVAMADGHAHTLAPRLGNIGLLDAVAGYPAASHVQLFVRRLEPSDELTDEEVLALPTSYVPLPEVEEGGDDQGEERGDLDPSDQGPG